MQIIPLSEGNFTIDSTKVFVPFDEEKDKLEDRPKGSLLVEIQPFLVKTSRDLLLLDTGLGYNSENGQLQLFNNIRKAGFDPDDITKVLLSHLHKDHSGGVSFANGNERRISFPKAKYFVQKKELEYALGPDNASYETEDFEMLGNGNVVHLDGDGKIDNYIRYEITGAHSKFHQVFWIEEDSEVLFFGADDAPQYNQMKRRFVAKYDYDGKRAAELREEWWEKGRAEGWKFLFYHDIKRAVV